MFEAKTNGAKWREMSAETVDAAAPQAMPTQPSEGQRPIAELVIEDIRARAEAGERRYGTKLYAHNGRRPLVDLYQELLDGAHYVRQEIEERAIATSSNAGVVGTVLLPLLDALGWDESKGEPVKWARQVVTERDAATAAGRDFERLRCEAAALHADLAEVTAMLGWSRHLGVDRGEWARSIVVRMGERAAEAESLKAGLRSLASIRDEAAAETHRWRDRALAAERDAERRAEEVGLWRARALEAESADRAAGDVLFAKSVALVEQVEVLRAAVRAARARAQKAEASIQRAADETYADEIRPAGEGYPPSGAPDPAQATAEVGSAGVAPAAPVETPQATETQPDPGEGWRLLGPEEVIETGDQWWGGAMVGPVWLAASATIGETPAAINAHPKATERRVFRRLIAAPIAAPIASAPVAEPVTEVAIEAQPDPGEGWRLLGPEEVIEAGDEWRFDGEEEWWPEENKRVLGIAASHEQAKWVRCALYYRRRITAPIAPAPVVEPSPEVVVEERGAKFIIVRRAVTP